MKRGRPSRMEETA